MRRDDLFDRAARALDRGPAAAPPEGPPSGPTNFVRRPFIVNQSYVYYDDADCTDEVEGGWFFVSTDEAECSWVDGPDFVDPGPRRAPFRVNKSYVDGEDLVYYE